MHGLGFAALGLLIAAASAQKPGAPAPSLSVARWLVGDEVAKLQPGTVYALEFWGDQGELATERLVDFGALQQKYGTDLVCIGVTHDGQTNHLEDVQSLYAEYEGRIGFRVAWDSGTVTHESWLGAGRTDELPIAVVVDRKGKVAWSGRALWLPLVLPDVVAGKYDSKALGARIDPLQKKLAHALQAAEAKPETAIPEAEGLAKESPFLAEVLWPQLFLTFREHGQRDLAMKVAGRAVDVGVHQGNATLLNRVAWTIVDPDVETADRDLGLALRAAQKAVDVTRERDASILDTLARVYFWKQDYTRAVALQTKAVGITTDADEKQQLQATLDEYRERAKGR